MAEDDFPDPSPAPETPEPGTEEPTPNVRAARPDGLADLEREISELLDAGPSSAAPIPTSSTPASPTAPPFSPPSSGRPRRGERRAAQEAELRAEVLRLRTALENLREEIVQHRSHLQGVHGTLERVSTALNGARTTDAPEARSAPLSAAPVFFLDEKGQGVASQAFFTLGKGGALERFLTEVIQGWETSGYPIHTKGGIEGFSLTLQGDPEGRGLRLLPSGMYLVRLGHEEMGRLDQLPPLVSSKALPRSGGFLARSSSADRKP